MEPRVIGVILAGALAGLAFAATDRGEVMQRPAKGTPRPLFEPSDAPWAAPPDLTPDVAEVRRFYRPGKTVGVTGINYLPDYLMYAYVFRHRPEGWKESDRFTGFVARIVVKSDNDGTVPLTAAWVADQPGRYDTIIDYDNGGDFSKGLDGLGGFWVLAEDSRWACSPCSLFKLRLLMRCR